MIDKHGWIIDLAALNARTPAELTAYLSFTGWAVRQTDDKGASWSREVDGKVSWVLQPGHRELLDYPIRVAELLRTLSEVEGRDQLDILREIGNVGMDTHRVRAFPEGYPPGMIGIDDGVQAFESLRNLVAAAAYAESAGQPRAVHPARKPANVLDLLRDVRIGPVTEGSFVFAVHVPVPPLLTSGDPESPETDPFERRVSLRLQQAVAAARAAADSAMRTGELDAFTRLVPEGLSANLCEALVGLGGGMHHPFEIDLRLAATRPMPGRTFATVSFSRDHFPVLRAAASQLRQLVPEASVLVEGNVVRLHREGTEAGEISLTGTVDGEDRLRRIWMTLPPDDYQLAMTAHREMRPLAVRGDLIRRGTRLWLHHPHDVQTREDDYR
ncbi:hypothetical protein [Longispora albida]|uniref:hypothetical protein n=1 Tax=Longispora albida TaxID=203523 RepID=UPI0003661646|nr:hypothetical protein [Longispora albida]